MKMRLLLFLLIKLALFETIGGELRIRPLRHDVVRTTGSSMVFTCEYISNDDGTDSAGSLVWLDNKGEVVGAQNGRKFVEDDLGVKKLYVISISEDDAGTYKCVKGNESVSINLHIFKDITFDDAPSVQYLNISSDGTIRCVVSGNPRPSRVSWMKNSRRINQPRFVVTREGLKVSNVTGDDEGSYVCIAEVEADGRYSERRIQVFVNYPPVIHGNLEQVDALLGSQAVVSCPVLGFPLPHVNFTKDEEEEVLSVADVVVANNTLTFLNVSKSHEGRYRCIATNILGHDSQTFSLNVLVPPKVIVPPFVMTVVGSEVTMSCLGVGDPVPYMMMSRKVDGRNLFEGEELSSGRMQASRSSGVLNVTIATATLEDSDTFTCTAVSPVGRSSEDVRLVVQYGPQFEVGNMTSLVYGWGNQVVQMNCKVRGEPKVNIQWFRGHDLVMNGDENYREFETPSGGVLQVSLRGESDEDLHGTYTCRATNDLGSDDFNFILKKPPVPDKPEVVLERLRPDDVTIRINSHRLLDEASFQVTHYLVSLVREDGAMLNTSVPIRELDQTSNFSTATSVLENLVPNASYNLFVSSVNPVGPGEATRVEFKTPESRIPDEVVANLASSDSNSVTLNWKPPYSGGSNITGYLVYHRKVESSGIKSLEPSSTWIESSVPPHFPPSFTVVPTGKDPQQDDETSYHPYLVPAQLTFEVGDLEPSSFYQVKVVAVNDIGFSPAQPEFFVRTNESSGGFLPFFLQTSNSSILVGLVSIVVIVLIVVVDVSCYVANDCGLLMCCCVLACGRTKKHSISPRKSKADKREFNELISSTKHPPSEGMENLPDEMPDVVVIDNGTTAFEPIGMQTENHLNVVGGGKEEERCPLVEEKQEEQSSDAAGEDAVCMDDDDDDDDDDADYDDGDDKLPTPPLVITSGPLHVEKSELITPKNRRSIMNFGDARWKDVVHELESQLGVKKPDLGEEEDEDEEDEYTGPSSPKWRHT